MSTSRTSTTLTSDQKMVAHADYCSQVPTLPQNPPRKWFEWGIQGLNWLQAKGQILVNILRNYVAWILLLNSFAAAALRKLPFFLLKALDIIVPGARLITSLRLLYRSASNKSEGKWTRGLFFLGGLAVLGLAIVAFILPPLALHFNLGTMLCNAVLGLWLLGEALKNKYGSEGKRKNEQLKKKQEDFYNLLAKGNNLESFIAYKTQAYAAGEMPATSEICSELRNREQEIKQEKNKNNDRNADLAIKAYNVVIIFVALAAIAMSFFPPTLIAGAAILVAANLHWLFLGYDIGGGWPQKIKNFFFPPSQPDSIEELKRQVDLRRSKRSSTAVTDLSLRDKENVSSATLLPASQTNLKKNKSEPSPQHPDKPKKKQLSRYPLSFLEKNPGKTPHNNPSQTTEQSLTPR